jgi:hypothetical protein
MVTASANTTGAVLVGALVRALLYGFTLLQTAAFFHYDRKDGPRIVKAVVSGGLIDCILRQLRLCLVQVVALWYVMVDCMLTCSSPTV